MNLLNQCQLWTDRGEDWKIVEAVEGLPEAERTPELVSELARAYNNLADGDRTLYERALSLLLPLEETMKDDYRWNFRVGYAYYYLDEEGPALRHFRKALAARPGDEEAGQFVRDCGRRLVAPLFERPFRTRVRDMWTDFQSREAALRALIDRRGEADAAEELLKLAASILDQAIRGAAFAVGKDGDQYVLTLSPEGDPVQLWKILYALRQAPEELRPLWRLEAGLPRKDGELRLDGQAVPGDAVSVQWERTERGIHFRLYAPVLAGRTPDAAQAAGALLLYQALGEVAAMRLMDGLDVSSAPPEGAALPLSRLAGALREEGEDLSPDGEACLAARAQAYGGHPIRDRDTDWRLDVTEGHTRCPEAAAGYLSGDDRAVDAFHRDGIAAGFFVWRPEDCPAAYRTAEKVRRALAAYVTEKAGPEAVTWTGWADGLYAGYLDCLAWDPEPVLDAAEAFFRQEGFRQGAFHTFRRRVPTAYFLKETAESAPAAPRKAILTEDVTEQLQACVEETGGYFARMFQLLQAWLVKGISEGRFTEAEARADRDTALWYAYACCNLGDYEWYYRAAQWMPDSEAQAAGCGMWYYRYSVALMGCGRLEEARTYAERGTREEPDYPWIWLQAAKLRSHFGDRAGALEAVERGLFLVPGDYEFRTLRAEILRGASLEEMEYHWIDPDSDKVLQDGLDEGADEKLRALSCLTTDEAALREIGALFPAGDAEWDAPYCRFFCKVAGHPVDLVFCMNRAGMSKLKIGWLRRLREEMDSGKWLTRPCEGGDEGLLSAVIVGLDYSVRLRYIPSRGDAVFDASPDGTPRKEAETDGDGSAAVLLRGGAWDRDAVVRALGAAGFDAEADGDDAVMASAGGLTAVLCFYPRPYGTADLPAHRSHVTAAVVGSGEPDAARRLLMTAVLACAALPDAAAVLTGGVCLTPEAWRAQADNTNF